MDSTVEKIADLSYRVLDCSDRFFEKTIGIDKKVQNIFATKKSINKVRKKIIQGHPYLGVYQNHFESLEKLDRNVFLDDEQLLEYLLDQGGIIGPKKSYEDQKNIWVHWAVFYKKNSHLTKGLKSLIQNMDFLKDLSFQLKKIELEQRSKGDILDKETQKLIHIWKILKSDKSEQLRGYYKFFENDFEMLNFLPNKIR